MTAFKSVLLIGAGGSLGAPVLRAFLESGSYEISILSRKESTSVFPAGVKVFNTDYDNRAELERAMKGQDVVISMVKPLAASGQNILVDAAIAAGVKRFLPSEFGPPSLDAKFAAASPDALGPKAATVDYLKTKESQISWTSIVTGAFFDWALENGFTGFDVQSKTAGLIDGGTSVFTASTLPYIAQAVLASLEHADETKNQYVFIGEFHINQQDILAAFEKIQGTKWNIKHQSAEDVRNRGRKLKEEGNPWFVAEFTIAAGLGKEALADNREWGVWDEKLGLKAKPLEQAIEEALIRIQGSGTAKA